MKKRLLLWVMASIIAIIAIVFAVNIAKNELETAPVVPTNSLIEEDEGQEGEGYFIHPVIEKDAKKNEEVTGNQEPISV